MLSFGYGFGFSQVLDFYDPKYITRTCTGKKFFIYTFFVLKKIMSFKLQTKIELYVINTVRKKRKETGISQQELAFLLDVSVGFIGDVESPKRRAKYNLNHLNELAKIFKCSPRDFLPEQTL